MTYNSIKMCCLLDTDPNINDLMELELEADISQFTHEDEVKKYI